MLSFPTIDGSTSQAPRWLISALPAMSSDLFKVRLSFSFKTKKLLQARALVAGESFFLMKLGPSFSLRF